MNAQSEPSDVTRRDRVRYWVDNALSHGITIVLLWVFAALVLLVVAVAVVTWLVGVGPGDTGVPFIENLWMSFTRSLDPGTFGADEGHRFRLAGVIVTLGGVLAVALVIGLVSNAIDRRLDDLRHGRSVVVEKDHTLVLGFSPKLPIVIRELIAANSHGRRGAIVVLTRQDKVELEELLKREVPDRKGVRVIVRRGDPASLVDLAQVRPREARSVIIVRPDEDAADARVVRVALAVHRAREGTGAGPSVVELADSQSARALRQALGHDVVTVVSRELVARIAAQASRGSGLGTVYQELLDFDGNELYLVPAPSPAIGRTFGEVALLSATAVPVGIIDTSDRSLLCPDFSRRIQSGDALIMFAEDDATIAFDAPCPPWQPSPQSRPLRAQHRVERTLIIGWNRFGNRIVEETDRLVLPGSQLLVLIDPSVGEPFDFDESVLSHQSCTVMEGSAIDRDVIAGAMQAGPFDHVMVLCSHDALPPVESDARVLLSLMHVRGILDSSDDAEKVSTNVITEVMELQSVELAEVARPDDFIVSQRLVSLMLTQLAENPHRKRILEEILGAEGVEVSIHRVDRYLGPGTYSFADLTAVTREFGVVLLGWQCRDRAGSPGYLGGGMRLNPSKSETVTLADSDGLIVMLEP